MDYLAVSREGELAVVCPRADIPAAVERHIRAALRDLVRSGVRRLVFDLKDIIAVDSILLSLLLATFNSIRSMGGTYYVVHASDEVLETCELLRIEVYWQSLAE